MAQNKTRLDAAVAERGLAETRSKAAALIMAGQVYVNGQKASKAGQAVLDTDKIEIRGEKLPYVSRGGLKLEKAISVFSLDLTDRICLDIGASTGGFTDCMLQNGARQVFSVDVGYGQLAWKLRTDPRVVNMERTNFRYLTPADFPAVPNFASIDVSFISLKIILPALYPILSCGGTCVCLVKPQFEAGREHVGKKGVVRDEQVHTDVLRGVAEFAFSAGFSVLGADFSPIRGPEGNIEYLLHLSKADRPALSEIPYETLVRRSHETLT